MDESKDSPQNAIGDGEDRDTRVRARAYAIWEQRGRPEGEQLDHWVQAQQELEAEQGAAGLKDGAVTDHVDEVSGASSPASANDSGGGTDSVPRPGSPLMPRTGRGALRGTDVGDASTDSTARQGGSSARMSRRAAEWNR